MPEKGRDTVFDVEAVIEDHCEAAPGARLMVLTAPEIARGALPGQFVMIRANRDLDPLLRRPFSICGTAPGGRVLILYQVVGRGTAILAQKRPGDVLQVMGPLGRGFSAVSGIGPFILVAGGMGIAPLLFLARRLVERGEGARIRFLAGFRGEMDFPSPDFLPDTGVPMEIATEDGSVGRHGLVTDLLEQVLAEVSEGSIFACGPRAMLKRVAELSAAAGLACRVSLESVMACGLGACLGCAVPVNPGPGRGGYLYVCKDGPVFEAGALDWARL
jgi:dihydroorotate dehydrogenase electron transfer subunit